MNLIRLYEFSRSTPPLAERDRRAVVERKALSRGFRAYIKKKERKSEREGGRGAGLKTWGKDFFFIARCVSRIGAVLTELQRRRRGVFLSRRP